MVRPPPKQRQTSLRNRRSSNSRHLLRARVDEPGEEFPPAFGERRGISVIEPSIGQVGIADDRASNALADELIELVPEFVWINVPAAPPEERRRARSWRRGNESSPQSCKIEGPIMRALNGKPP